MRRQAEYETTHLLLLVHVGEDHVEQRKGVGKDEMLIRRSTRIALVRILHRPVLRLPSLCLVWLRFAGRGCWRGPDAMLVVEGAVALIREDFVGRVDGSKSIFGLLLLVCGDSVWVCSESSFAVGFLDWREGGGRQCYARLQYGLAVGSQGKGKSKARRTLVP